MLPLLTSGCESCHQEQQCFRHFLDVVHLQVDPMERRIEMSATIFNIRPLQDVTQFSQGCVMKSISDKELNSFDLSLKPLLQQILHSARLSLDMEFAFISEFRDGRRIFRLVENNDDLDNLLQEEASDPLESSYCQRIVDGRLPQIICNARDLDEANQLPATQSIPVGAHLSVPLIMEDGSIFGTFCCFSRKPDYAMTSKDLMTLKGFADLAFAMLKDSITQDRQRLASKRLIEDIIQKRLYTIVYQPIFDLSNHSIVGVEALTRFVDHDELTTEAWFNLATRSGLAYELETATAKAALEPFSDLGAECYLSINLSPETIIRGADLSSMFARAESELLLEVTEHERIDDYSRFAQGLGALRADAIKIAVDDAGSGFASFQHILQLKPDVIKLDRALISGIDRDLARSALASALVTFARSTGAKVVAEGIETQEELETLKQLGVSFGQGFFLGKPLSLEELKQHLSASTQAKKPQNR